eukprot:11755200-Prorocentrum_lima.AAC.1
MRSSRHTWGTALGNGPGSSKLAHPGNVTCVVNVAGDEMEKRLMSCKWCHASGAKTLLCGCLDASCCCPARGTASTR